MKLGIGIKTSLGQTLTPQQIQYLKLLQLPVAQLEQQVMQEIEMNPMLEEAGSEDDFEEVLIDLRPIEDESPELNERERSSKQEKVADSNDYEQQKELITDKSDPFELQNLMWEGSDPDLPKPKNRSSDEDDEDYGFQIKDTGDFTHELLQQLRLSGISPKQDIIAETIIGNLDSDGYLRRIISEIDEEVNENIAEYNFELSKKDKVKYSSNSHNGKNNTSANEPNISSNPLVQSLSSGSYAQMFGTVVPKDQEILEEDNNYGHKNKSSDSNNSESHNSSSANPALMFALSDNARSTISKYEPQNIQTESNRNGVHLNNSISDTSITPSGKVETKKKLEYIQPATLEEVEAVRKMILRLEPAGLASTSVRECLMVQLELIRNKNPYQQLAYDILDLSYDAFSKKHYEALMRNHEIDSEELKWAIDEIRSLNPKPGGLDYQHEINTVIPDFVVEKAEEENELLISVNDSRVPQIKLSKAYEAMQLDAQNRDVNKETKNWLRGKRDDAKFLIQAVKQRKNTMMKVMTAIANCQKEFFFEGPDGIKPLIYKNIAEITGLDISTVCRIVNGKYVLTPYGTFELKYFFSESLPTEEGEEISTKIIKNKLKEIVDGEDKKKPFSDEKLSSLLKEEGFLVARRTVAKYREQLNLPVARLRKEL
ncbi:MAG: hypothetical protein Kapaf2KO_20200 [Candidatus Kapaibacteriales bacterium]